MKPETRTRVAFGAGFGVGAITAALGLFTWANLSHSDDDLDDADFELDDEFDDNFIHFANDEDVKKTASGQKDDENRPNCFDKFKDGKEPSKMCHDNDDDDIETEEKPNCFDVFKNDKE